MILRPGRNGPPAGQRIIGFLHKPPSLLVRVSYIQLHPVYSYTTGPAGLNIPINTTPLTINVGRRPCSSDIGASTIGASANPMQKMVMDRLATITLTFHLAAIIDDAALASPAEKLASSVTPHAIQVIHVFFHCDQLNGEVYFSRLGGSGAADCPGPGGRAMRGVGRGVLNSRYLYSTSSVIILYSFHKRVRVCE